MATQDPANLPSENDSSSSSSSPIFPFQDDPLPTYNAFFGCGVETFADTIPSIFADECCPICREPLSLVAHYVTSIGDTAFLLSHHDTIVGIPSCGHFFHRACLRTWTYNHPTCPMDRAVLCHKQDAITDRVVESNLRTFTRWIEDWCEAIADIEDMIDRRWRRYRVLGRQEDFQAVRELEKRYGFAVSKCRALAEMRDRLMVWR